MCVATSDLPTSGPHGLMILPISPAKCASAASLLILSHSKPQPEAGAGWFSLPVVVWPMRRIVHLPSGTSQVELALFVQFARQVHEYVRRDDLVGRRGGPDAGAGRAARPACKRPCRPDCGMRELPAGVGNAITAMSS